MRIAHITYGFGIGGIETMLANIAGEQSREHEVHIIVINDIVDSGLVGSLPPGVTLHLIGRRRDSRNPWPYLKMNMILRRLGPDVVHLHYASIRRFIVSRDLRRKLCVTLHDMCTPVNSQWLHKCGPVFAISDVVKEDIRRTKGLEAITVYNGINPAKIYVKEGLTQHERLDIVQVSRLMHEKKGQDILIKSIKALYDEGYDNVRLTFIGEGASREYLEGLVAQLGLEDKVEFLGNRSQEYVFGHLKDYDLFVQPSRFEGFGLTVAEAMAARVPVLVSDIQGPMEVVDYGRCGMAFKSDDVDDCTRVLKSIIDNGYDEKMVETAYRRVHQIFNVRETARRYVELYDKLVISRQDA